MSNGSAADGGDPQKPTSSISSQDTGEFYKCHEKTMKMRFVFWSATQVSLSTIVIVTFTPRAEATFWVNCDGINSLAFFLYVSSRKESCLQ